MIKANAIVNLEKILADLEKTPNRIPRNAELYFVTIFGEPATNRTWAGDGKGIIWH